MGKAARSGSMEILTLVLISMIKLKAMVNIIMQMALFTRVNGDRVNNMDKAAVSGLTEILTQEHG